MTQTASAEYRGRRDASWCLALGALANAIAAVPLRAEILRRAEGVLIERAGIGQAVARLAPLEGEAPEPGQWDDLTLAVLATGVRAETAEQVALPIISGGRVAAVLRVDLKPMEQLVAEHFLGLVATLIGLAFDHAEMLLAIEERDTQRTHLLHRLLFAHEEERRRMGRELHDEVGSLLTGSLLALQAAEARPEAIAAAREGVVRAMDEVRRVSRELRPAIIEDLGLTAAVEKHAREIAARSSLALSLDLDANLPPMGPAQTIGVYRIFQEALTNVARHASAKNVRVSLALRGSALVGAVSDDGLGFNPNESHDSVGLVGMRERAEQLGGDLIVESGAGRGTVVRFSVGLT